MRLADKVAIITGSASGIGYSKALAMVREGASVVIADIGGEGATRVAEEIKSSGGKALAVHMDVANEAQVNDMVARTIKEFGKIDKDVLKISGKAAGIEPMALEKPKTEEIEEETESLF